MCALDRCLPELRLSRSVVGAGPSPGPGRSRVWNGYFCSGLLGCGWSQRGARFERRGALLLWMAEDDARVASIGHVRPDPLRENGDPIPKTDQERDVDEEPGEPRDEPTHLQAS